MISRETNLRSHVSKNRVSFLVFNLLIPTMQQSSALPQQTTAKRASHLWTEWTVLFLILAAGLAVRVAYPSRMAVEHFDEGVYASNIWFGAEDQFQYPAQYLYAPPLLPWLVQWSITIFGTSHVGVMLTNVVIGSLTVGLVWWVARCWFGRVAGLTAAVLAAFSDFHILYSRTVLTDPLLCFWMLLAVYLFWESYRRRDWQWAAATGIVSGLAWWTKYNGWLPLAVGIAGLMPWLFLHRKKENSAGWYLFLWMVGAATAVAVWIPVVFDLSDFGGYSIVRANHSGYLVGLDGWFDSLTQQFGNHRRLDGWLGCAGVALALLLPAILPADIRQCFTWNDGESEQSLTNEPNPPANSDGEPSLDSASRIPVGSARFLTTAMAIALLCFSLAAACGSAAVLAIGSLLGIGLHLWPRRLWKSKVPGKIPIVDSETSLAVWLLAAWIGGLLVATPFYRPYPRLTLPLLVALWLGTAALVGWLVQMVAGFRPATPSPEKRGIGSHLIFLVIACIVFVITMFASSERLMSRGVPGWQDRTGLAAISARIIDDLKKETSATRRGRFAVYVYGEPGLFFHLATTRLPVRPIDNLNFDALDTRRLGISVYLITGPQAQRSREFQSEWNVRHDQFRLIERHHYSPSDLVLLNAYSPAEIASPNFESNDEIRLYRLLPTGR